jgi:NADH:ubiquinone oxidoreductase subunit 5 (subunit L)/multisubunit Na+/H+ antiporter MnhA subunit
MVAVGIFLIVHLFPLFQALPLVMGVISWTCATMLLEKYLDDELMSKKKEIKFVKIKMKTAKSYSVLPM